MRGKPATCVTDRTRASWPTQSLTRTDTLIFRNYSLWFPHSRPAQSCQDLISNTRSPAWLKTCPSRRTSDVKTELRWFWKHLALKIQLNVSLTIQIKLRWAYTIIHNYTEYNVFSAFNPSKWSSGQSTLRRPGRSCGSHLSRGHFLPEPGFEPTTLGYLGFQVQRRYPLGPSSLHLTHPKRIRTIRSGHPSYGTRGAVRGSVPCSRALQSWYWIQFLPARVSNPRTLGYKPDSLTIRPRLPHCFNKHKAFNSQKKLKKSSDRVYTSDCPSGHLALHTETLLSWFILPKVPVLHWPKHSGYLYALISD